MERNDIIEILKSEGYPQFMLEKTADKIVAFKQEIADAFEALFTNKENPSVSIEGFSYETLVTDYKMNPVGALITLDWLIREPEIAKEALKKGVK